VKGIKNARDRQQNERWERCKASMRAKVEHPFRVIKRQFGHTTARWRGLAKNSAQVLPLFALPNSWMTRRRFLSAKAPRAEGRAGTLPSTAVALALHTASAAPPQYWPVY